MLSGGDGAACGRGMRRPAGSISASYVPSPFCVLDAHAWPRLHCKQGAASQPTFGRRWGQGRRRRLGRAATLLGLGSRAGRISLLRLSQGEA